MCYKSLVSTNREHNSKILFKLIINPSNPITQCDSSTGVKIPNLYRTLKSVICIIIFSTNNVTTWIFSLYKAFLNPTQLTELEFNEKKIQWAIW